MDHNHHIWTHDEKFSKADAVLHPDLANNLSDTNLIEIIDIESDNEDAWLILQVVVADRDLISRHPMLQLSVASHIASAFGLTMRRPVRWRPIHDASSPAADFVVLSDMFRIRQSLVSSVVYVGRKLLYAGCIRTQVKESAKYFIFLQMCREMFSWTDDGEDLMMERAVDGFLHSLFRRWKALGTNHVVSIVLYSRVRIKEDNETTKKYQDIYHAIIDWETRLDWLTTLPVIRKEVSAFRSRLKQILGIKSWEITFANDGNTLEAVNLALNIFDKHYIDRDLLRTGLSIVVVTPGCGLMHTTRRLFRLTTQRMVDNGIGLDLVCLGNPPLYTVPLFRVKNEVSDELDEIDGQDFAQDDSPRNVFTAPHWVDISFYFPTEEPFREVPRGTFINQCRMGSFEPGHQFPTSQNEPQVMPSLTFSSSATFSMDDYDRAVVAGDPLPDSIFIKKPMSDYTPDISNELQLAKSTPANNYLGRPGLSRLFRDRKLPIPPSSQNEASPLTEVSSSWEDKSNPDLTEVEEPSQLKARTSSLNIPVSQSKHALYDRRNEVTPSPDNMGGMVTSSSYKHILRQSPSYSRPKSPSPNILSVQDKNTGLKPYPSSSPPNTRTGLKQAVLYNPCMPHVNIIKWTSYLRRWHHVFSETEKKNIAATDWASLSTPASLPLTTDYFPSSRDLKLNYREYAYLIAPDDWQSSNSVTETLLFELLAQRLAQGFQLIIERSSDDVSEASQLTKLEISTSSFESGGRLSFVNDKSGNVPVYYLSMGNQIHRLTYDSATRNIEVKRYVRHLMSSPDPLEYEFTLIFKDTLSFVQRRVLFSYTSWENYNWNYLDNLVAGYQDELIDSLRFWKTRFILIPVETLSSQSISFLSSTNEQLDEEELRLAGFTKFIELFHKSRWVPSDETPDEWSKKKDPTRKVPIVLTTFNPSRFIANELANSDPSYWETHEKYSSIMRPSSSEKLTQGSPLHTIAGLLQHPTLGVPIKDRRWHLRFYERVFLGSDCVDWLIRSFVDIDTRDQAVEFGNVLIEKNVFEHVNQQHKFLDGHYFYRVTKEFTVAESKEKGPLRWFRKSDRPESASAGPTATGIPKQSLRMVQDKSTHEQRYELSRKVVIDLDPQKKSTRPEVAELHYSTIHNPRNCYHFRLHWLVCTARLIDEMLQSWTRLAEKCGYRLVEAPIEQARVKNEQGYSEYNPFQCPVSIPLALTPPDLDRTRPEFQQIPDFYFESELVKHFGFVLDVESDSRFPNDKISYSYTRSVFKHTQYVHRSGIAFVQLRSSGFLWVPNRLVSSHIQYAGHGTTRHHHMSSSNLSHLNNSNATTTTTQQHHMVQGDWLRKKFEMFCQDGNELSVFWSECLKKATTSKGKNVLLDDVPDDALVDVPAELHSQ